MIIDITVVVNQQIDESLRPEKVKVTLNDTVLNVSKETVELTKENNWTYKYLAKMCIRDSSDVYWQWKYCTGINE